MFEKVLKDPVHDEILFDDPLLWALVNVPAFQRLRRIRQLGTSYLTFHGAEHSRFAHSLGAYETMRRVLYHLQRESGWPTDPREIRLALAAALLHDVGHGPFSHTFESVLGVQHEAWTHRIILEDPALRSVLDGVDDEFAPDLVRVLRRESRYPAVESLISSQLDVDRMDYMLRDAEATGVSYGLFELARLIRSLTYWDGRIYVKRQNLHTVEQYLLARYFMYVQVYLHPVTVGSDVLVEKILVRAKDLIAEGERITMPEPLRRVLDGDMEDVSWYIRLDESVLLYAFHTFAEHPDPILRDLAERFLHRRLFAPVVRQGPTPVDDLALLRTTAKAMGFHPDYYVSLRACKIPGYDVIGQGLLLRDASGRVEDLSQASKLIRTLVPSSEERMFLPKEMLDPAHPLSARVRSIAYSAL
ncbi:HD domain-containing protein [Alicyclobacillus sendaiensis]|uniref:HD domain-containing protein n=1 Tax=Alicyclobacillus sendaiensis PA2 TaxID=3029425 RepID=A0ABT6XYG0_ALISE|nr:HD domain-containing protein [Alicyclobacillus sendaiensis]MDI9260129.1 HD domain-containing protein [Alicyclobacillus sendaiensis PA2]